MRAPLSLSTLAVLILLTAGAPSRERGKEIFDTVCATCHTLTPPPGKAPPMLMIAGHYAESAGSEDAAREAMRKWIPAPEATRSLLPSHAVERFGLMAPLPLPEADIEAVVGYVFDQWSSADRPEARGPRCQGDSCGTGMRMGQGMQPGHGMRMGQGVQPGHGMRMGQGRAMGLNQESDGTTVCPPGMCSREPVQPEESSSAGMCGGACRSGSGMQHRHGSTTGLNQDSTGATVPPAESGCGCGAGGRCGRR